MHTIIKFANGRRTEGMLLLGTPDFIRVVLRRQSDTTEFRRVFGAWIAEDGSSIELDFLAAADFGNVTDFLSDARQTAISAN